MPWPLRPAERAGGATPAKCLKPLRPRSPRPRRGIKLPMPRRTRSSIGIGNRPQDVPPFRPTGPAPPRGSGPQFWRLPTAAKIVCLHVRAQWTDRQRHFYSRSEKTRPRQDGLRRRQEGGGFPFPFEWRLLSSSSRYLSEVNPKEKSQIKTAPVHFVLPVPQFVLG